MNVLILQASPRAKGNTAWSRGGLMDAALGDPHPRATWRY